MRVKGSPDAEVILTVVSKSEKPESFAFPAWYNRRKKFGWQHDPRCVPVDEWDNVSNAAPAWSNDMRGQTPMSPTTAATGSTRYAASSEPSQSNDLASELSDGSSSESSEDGVAELASEGKPKVQPKRKVCKLAQSCSNPQRKDVGGPRQSLLGGEPRGMRGNLNRASRRESNIAALYSVTNMVNRGVGGARDSLLGGQRMVKKRDMKAAQDSINEEQGNQDTSEGQSRKGPRKSEFPSSFDIMEMSKEFNLPKSTILHARRLFDRYDASGDGVLDPEEFQLLIRSLLKEQYPKVKDVPKELFEGIDQSGDGELDFHEFLQWFSTNSFSEKVLLDPVQQKIRGLSRKYKVAIDYVEDTKHEFDKFDTDSSGEIDEREFKQLLNALLKVPSHVDLPDNRVRSFWKEIDADNSGTVDFEEFFAWYRRYFEGGKVNFRSPIEQFYASVRWVPGSRTAKGY